MKFDSFLIQNDDEMQIIFHCRENFPEIRTTELFVKLEDVAASSGGSAPNPHSTSMGGVSAYSSVPPVTVPVVASSAAAPVVLVASPSFAADLNHDDEAARAAPGIVLSGSIDVRDADGIEEALGDDSDDEEPPIIGGDSEDDRGSIPTRQGSHPSSSETQQYPPPHFSNLDLIAMAGEGVPDVGSGSRHGNSCEVGTGNEFRIGQCFSSKEEAVLSVKNYSIRRGVEYKVLESDHVKYHGKCKEFGNGCSWLIRITFRQRKGYWEVRRYNGAHTCLATQVTSDHRQLDYHVICASILPMVRADASVTIKVLQNATEATYGFRPSYRKVWLAKQKAIAQIYGNWEESYNDLPKWIRAVQMTMPGSVALIQTTPVRVGNGADESSVYFHRLFWTFPPCVEAFKYCKPLISIDGTHLYGKYGGSLLLAIAQDGNSNILPVAFALVEGENSESWKFFLSNLRRHVATQQGILVISDRHNGIKAALQSEDGGWLPPSAYRAFCIRHVAANFALSFKCKDARRFLVNAAYAKTELEFHYWFDILRSEDPAMCDWANRMEYAHWTQHKDEGRRFGHMTTNISECVNSVLKGTRNLPVTSLVTSTYCRLAELFVRRGREAEAQLASGHQFCEVLRQAVEANMKASRNFTITLYDRATSEFTVEETTPTGGFSLSSYRVSLSQRTCDCGYFEALHYPCRHVLACCTYARLDWAGYVHDVYRMSTVFQVYRLGFNPPIPVEFWPPYDGPRVIPDPTKRRASEGRPRTTRIRNSMDEAEPDRPKRCGLCRQPGHTRRTCPSRGGATGTSGGAGSNG